MDLKAHNRRLRALSNNQGVKCDCVGVVRSVVNFIISVCGAGRKSNLSRKRAAADQANAAGFYAESVPEAGIK